MGKDNLKHEQQCAIHDVMRCVNCKFYSSNDEIHGDCSNDNFFIGYGNAFIGEYIKDNGVQVEGDEGWGFMVGKNFGCIHFQHNA